MRTSCFHTAAAEVALGPHALGEVNAKVNSFVVAWGRPGACSLLVLLSLQAWSHPLRVLCYLRTLEAVVEPPTRPQAILLRGVPQGEAWNATTAASANNSCCRAISALALCRLPAAPWAPAFSRSLGMSTQRRPHVKWWQGWPVQFSSARGGRRWKSGRRLVAPCTAPAAEALPAGRRWVLVVQPADN